MRCGSIATLYLPGREFHLCRPPPDRRRETNFGPKLSVADVGICSSNTNCCRCWHLGNDDEEDETRLDGRAASSSLGVADGGALADHRHSRLIYFHVGRAAGRRNVGVGRRNVVPCKP